MVFRILSPESLQTVVTLEGVVGLVCFLMTTQGTDVGEFLAAVFAAIQSLPLVAALVSRQHLRVTECLIAFMTLIWGIMQKWIKSSVKRGCVACC